MFSRLQPVHLFLFVLLLISIVYLQGVASVPFHPDEGTYLFMSTDLSQAIKNPAAIFWKEGANDERTNLRLLDPPLVHYTVEIGRRLGRLAPLPTNWRWKLNWDDNEQRGAIPSPQLLLAGRLAVAGLFPLSLLFLYLAARRLANEFTAWVTVLLMATNALILLHTRRAMAEGILIFTLALTLWGLMKAEKRPWLAALPIGLAFCAKASLAALSLVGLVAAAWQPGKKLQAARRAGQIALYGLLFLGIIYLLTPTAWRYPLQAALAASRARQTMTSGSVVKYSDQAVVTPLERAASLVNQVYFAPLMFYEDAGYVEHIQAAQDAYLANPGNTLFRSPLAGSILLALGLFGFAAGCFQAASRDPIIQRRFSLLLAATLLQLIALLVAIPLSWQRYYLPLVPFACIWAAYGVNQLKELLSRSWATRRIVSAQ